jgi:hypothetical protein
VLDNFHSHYIVEVDRLVPERLASAAFLSSLSGHQQQQAQAVIMDLVTGIHNDVVRSFRRELFRSEAAGTTNNTPSTTPETVDQSVAAPEIPDATSMDMMITDPNAAFLSYLYQVAPPGALTPELTDLDGQHAAGFAATDALEDPNLINPPALGTDNFSFTALQALADGRDTWAGLSSHYLGSNGSGTTGDDISHSDGDSRDAEDPWFWVDRREP